MDRTRINRKSVLSRALVALALLSLVVSVIAVAGRGDKSGTAAAQELLIPIGAREIALGGSTMADVAGIDALYWNPAGLVRSEDQTNVMFSHMSYLADIAVDYGALSTTIPDIASFGVSVTSLSFGKIPVTTEDYPDGTGETASPSFVILGGAVSRLVTDHISFGFECNVVIENMDKVSATGVAFTFGLQYRGLGGIDGLSLGASVNNIGPAMTYDGDGLLRVGQVDDVLRPETQYKIQAASSDMPSAIIIGLGYTALTTENETVKFTSIYQNNNYSDDEYRLGAEWTTHKIVSLRLGYSGSAEGGSGSTVYGLSLGVGVAGRFEGIDLSVDYAYRSAQYFAGNHVLTLGLGF